jgi:hypothetical protein
MQPRSYLDIPFPFEFTLKLLADTVSSYEKKLTGLKNIPYDQSVFDLVFNNKKVVQEEFTRTRIKFGDAKPKHFGQKGPVVLKDFFEKVIASAKDGGIELTEREAQALFVYASSLGGELIQGGLLRSYERIYKLFFNTLLNIIITHPNKKFDDDELILTHVIKNDGVLEVITTFAANEPEQEDQDFITIKTSNVFRLKQQENGDFNLIIDSKEQLCLIDSDFWFDRVLPAGKNILNKKELLAGDLFACVVLLSEPSFRELFCKKLISQPFAIKKMAFEYIRLYCAENSTVLQRIQKDYAHNIELIEAMNVDFLAAKIRLETLLSDCTADNYLLAQPHLEAASAVIDAIDQLSKSDQVKHSALLTQIMIRTEVAIKEPHNNENLARYQVLIQQAQTTRLRNIAVAMTLVVASVTIMTLAIVAAVASFGVSSMLSGVGMLIGVNMLTQALAISMAIIGAGAVAGSSYMASHRGLKDVNTSVVRFWQPLKNKMLQEKAKPTVENGASKTVTVTP